jgi:RNA binding exosome subunit
MSMSKVDIPIEDREKVFLYLAKLFEDEIKKNLHTSEIKTEIIGLYGIKIIVEKNNFTHDEVSFLSSLISPSDYIKNRMEVRVSFLKDIHGNGGGLEFFIVPKPRLISYFAKRLSYY